MYRAKPARGGLELLTNIRVSQCLSVTQIANQKMTVGSFDYLIGLLLYVKPVQIFQLVITIACICFLGVILSTVVDVDPDKQDFLLVLDAKTFTEIARAYVPKHVRVPFSFHGSYYKV